MKQDLTVRDIIRHPLFNGFGRFIFPTMNGKINESLKIREIDSLLPYHSHINPETTQHVLDYLFDEVDQGKSLFYDFYSESQKQSDPEKRDTGLFFFRGKPNAPFAVICPGGGFSYVGSIHEGFPHAIKLSEHGFNAFVIHYRLGSGQKATEDLAAALSWIFKNAMELHIDTQQYSLWGSSAGARMAANIGSHGTKEYGGDDCPKPSAVIMAYTGHTDMTGNEPPTFAIVGSQDGIANPSVMKHRIKNLSRLGIVTEYQEIPGLDHGFGLGVGTLAQDWIEDAIAFWQRQFKD